MTSTRAVPRLAIVGAAVLLSAAAAPRYASDASIADAEMRGDTSAVRLLLKQGADVNAAQGDGMTALHWAAMHGDVDQTRMLVYAGARLEASTRNGNYTPLHLAAQTGKTSVIKALVQAGADVNAATTAGGATPLHYAAANGNADAIVALLDKGAKVDARESAWSETPLMWAAASNRVSALQVLVSRGADLKAVSKLEDMPAREKAERAALTLRARRVAALKSAEQGPPAPGAAPGPAPGRGGARRCAADGRSRRSERRGNSAPPAAPDTTGLRPRSSLPPDTAGGGRGDRGPSLRRSDRKQGWAQCAAVRRAPGEHRGGERAAQSGRGRQSGEHGRSYESAAHGDDQRPLRSREGAARARREPKLASDAGTTPLYATINVQWAAKSLYPQPTAQLRQQTTYLELMEALLKAGADPNARLTKHLWYMSYNFDLLGVNTTGATPFWRAAYGTDVAGDEVVVGARRGSQDSDDQARRPAARRAMRPPRWKPATKDPSGLAPIPAGGPGVFPIHAASGVGYGEGYAANSHQHAPDGLAAVGEVSHRGAARRRQRARLQRLHAAAPRRRARRQRADPVFDVEGRRHHSDKPEGPDRRRHGERTGAAHSTVPRDARAAREAWVEEQPQVQVLLTASPGDRHEAQRTPQHSRFLIEAADLIAQTPESAAEGRGAAGSGSVVGKATRDIIEVWTSRCMMSHKSQPRFVGWSGFASAALALLFASQTAHAQATTVILVRHGEKAARPADDPPLTNDGERRARDLAATLADARVSMVIATQFVRSQETAKPVAVAAHQTVITVPATADPKAHAAAVAAKVRSGAAGGTVVIVGHSNTIPLIIEALGGPTMQDLCDAEYANLFVLEMSAAGPPKLIRSRYGTSDPVGSDKCTRTMRK